MIFYDILCVLMLCIFVFQQYFLYKYRRENKRLRTLSNHLKSHSDYLVRELKIKQQTILKMEQAIKDRVALDCDKAREKFSYGKDFTGA